ncbi:Cadmium resistance transporter [Trichormus variabilis ATCC 29413]|uniref:Cadmium resistance transporter n=2 Tax=Anabaena variabilis TaxID=264691 RepID=Q3M3D0_TRIV2|nr:MULTISPECIES: cadmium resistance transporter [Nostocaceae]ABA24506.1 Cadmium resistance transporter [Trichormus variabilis ATCC 29413]MBC1212894.1 cadmium resistance transporter [Trichormus variabilis ARAD]MBC1267223.1 cadmium resistance transporter [Trichormus variabilis FSR]MBC1301339.1 cadmium resistance transporter [Trichormus variabilis N2B]MBC1309620.1 cadmium resistance transporter [Trichormus variabilis PNB]
MNQLVTAFTESLVAFAATNIDDIIILLLLFSQVDANFRRSHIWVGHFLGFSIIILASLPGFFGGLFVQREFIGLLGILPIIIGIKQLVTKEQENTQIQAVTTDLKGSSPAHPILAFICSILHPQVYKVAAVTVANGGDNISIYIPLFAGQNLVTLGVILGVFFFMVGIWCVTADLLSRQAPIAYVLSLHGKTFIPFILIALGLFIMYERGTFSLLMSIKI